MKGGDNERVDKERRRQGEEEAKKGEDKERGDNERRRQ